MAKRPTQPSYGRRPQPQPPQAEPQQGELPGILGFMARNPQLLGWLNLLATIFLFYFAISGFLGGVVFLPFGFGLMGLYFFYAYIRVGLKVNLGKLTTPLNMVLLIGALICLVLGMTTNS
jgi:hypothetical protein